LPLFSFSATTPQKMSSHTHPIILSTVHNSRGVWMTAKFSPHSSCSPLGDPTTVFFATDESRTKCHWDYLMWPSS